ncbi:hypothetical protein FOZ63_024149, partial [Perkinsus olseni]
MRMLINLSALLKPPTTYKVHLIVSAAAALGLGVMFLPVGVLKERDTEPSNSVKESVFYALPMLPAFYFHFNFSLHPVWSLPILYLAGWTGMMGLRNVSKLTFLVSPDVAVAVNLGMQMNIHHQLPARDAFRQPTWEVDNMPPFGHRHMYPANPHIDANHSYVALPFLCVEALRLIQDDERAESASLDGGVKATKSYFAPGMILTAAMRGVILNAIGQSSLQYQRVNGSVPSMLLRAKLSRAQKGLETSSGREDVGCMNECPVCGQWFSHKGYMEHTKYNTPIQPTEGSRLRNSEMSNSLVEWEPGYPGYPGLPKHAFLRINAGSCRQLRSTPPCQARSMLRQHGFWFNSQIFRGRLGPLLDLARHREALLEKENVNMYQYDYYADGLTRASDVIDADGVDYREYFNTLREHVSFLVGEIFPELSVTYQEGHDKVRFFNGSYHTPLHADHTLQHRLVGYDTTNCTLLTVWVALSRTKK